MSFRRLLCLAAMALSLLMILALGVLNYIDVRASVGELIDNTAEVQLATISDALNGELEAMRLTCETLQKNPGLGRYVDAINSPDSIASERLRAYNAARGLFYVALTNCQYAKNIIVRTPVQTFRLERGPDAMTRAMALDCEAASDIELRMPSAGGAEEGGGERMSGSAYFSCRLACDETYELFMAVDEDLITDAVKAHISDAVVARLYDFSGEPAFGEGDGDVPSDVTREFWASGAASARVGGYMLYRASVFQGQYALVYACGSDAYMREYDFLLRSALIAFAVTAAVIFVFAGMASNIVLRPVRHLSGRMRGYALEAASARPRERRLTMRESLLLFLIVAAVTAMAVFTALFGGNAVKVMNRQRRESYYEVVRNVAGAISAKLDTREQAMTRIINDADILRGLSADDAGQSVRRVVEENVYYGLYDDTLDIYDASGNRLYTNNLAAAGQGTYEAGQIGLQWRVARGAGDRLRFSLLAQAHDNSALLGGVRLSFDSWNVSETVRAMSSPGVELAIGDGGGAAVLGEADFSPAGLDGSARPDSQGVTVAEGGGRVYISKRLGERPFYVMLRYSPVTLWSYGIEMLAANAYLFIALVAAAFAMAYILASFLNRPLKRTCASLRELKPCGGGEAFADSFIDDITEINQAFNDMTQHINTLVEDLIDANSARLRLENDCKNAEIAALQMQINPHFLANTFETISCIILEGKGGQACGMLRSLNSLFRYAISKPEYIITVREEMEYVRAYVDIMRVRYSGLRVEWRIDERALESYTIKLLVQPILENAIRHGFGIPSEGNLIVVECLAQAEGICYVVSDNGSGMEPEALKRLRADLADARLGSYIGLFNVQARVRLYCGGEYGLTIESRKGEGTRVSVRIPHIGEDGKALS